MRRHPCGNVQGWPEFETVYTYIFLRDFGWQLVIPIPIWLAERVRDTLGLSSAREAKRVGRVLCPRT